MNDDEPVESIHARAMTPVALQRLALFALAVLALVSAGFALVTTLGARGGTALAVAKIVVLAFLFVRVWKNDVYAMQWSSMFVLLFLAEGIVRAMTDPSPSSMLGAAEALGALAYFAAVLAVLRPLKRAARAARR